MMTWFGYDLGPAISFGTEKRSMHIDYTRDNAFVLQMLTGADGY